MSARKLPPDSELVLLYRSGLSAMEIGERYVVSYQAVTALLRRIGEPLRPIRMAQAMAYANGRGTGDGHYAWKGGAERRPYRKIVGNKERCWECDATVKLCVHHLDLDHHNNAPGNLRVLCMTCHLSLHKRLYWAARRAGIDPVKSTGTSHWRKPSPTGDGAACSKCAISLPPQWEKRLCAHCLELGRDGMRRVRARRKAALA